MDSSRWSGLELDVSRTYFTGDSGAIRTIRSRKKARADDDRRYAPQYVHIPAVSRNVLKEGAAGWRS